MKIVDTASASIDGLFGTAPEEFPFAFSPAYAQVLSLAGDTQIFLKDMTLQAFAPIRLYPRRVIRCSQWLSPPMRGGQLLTPFEERRFIEEGNWLLQRVAGCNRIISPPNYAIFQVAPERSRHCQFGTYVLKLENRTEAEILAGMREDHRRHIRQAGGNIIIRSGGDQVQIFHLLLAETMKRARLMFPSLQELKTLATILGPQGCVCIVSYSADGTPQGGLLALTTREGAYGIHSGSVSRPAVKGAIKAVHWELIRHCINNGIKKYDFVGARLSDVSGTKLAGIQSYKAGFGGVLQQGYLWKLDLTPMITRAFDSANRLRKKYLNSSASGYAPYVDIIDQELSRSPQPQR